MWQYQKTLQYPVKIKQPNARLAKMVITQLGGLNSTKIYESIHHAAEHHLRRRFFHHAAPIAV